MIGISFHYFQPGIHKGRESAFHIACLPVLHPPTTGSLLHFTTHSPLFFFVATVASKTSTRLRPAPCTVLCGENCHFMPSPNHQLIHLAPDVWERALNSLLISQSSVQARGVTSQLCSASK